MSKNSENKEKTLQKGTDESQEHSTTHDKGKKRPIEEVTGSEEKEARDKVHSANDWEHVKLGGEERKEKFLRLMGGKKKDHHGKIIIGDPDQKTEHQHRRSENDNKEIEEKLEAEFKHGLDHKLSGNARRHVGLGFTKEKPAEPVSSTGEPANGEKPASGSGEPENTEASLEENQSKPDSTSDSTNDAESASSNKSKKPGMMNFVKSSS